jgi:hypothetical protein
MVNATTIGVRMEKKFGTKLKQMIIQTIHEIVNPFDVETPLGYGVAIFMIAGSIHSNPQFIIRLYNTGDVRTVDQNDIKIYGNPTTGESLNPSK